MKRIYLLLVLLSISFSTLSADQGFLTWTVVGFDHTEWATGENTLVAYDDNNKEYKVNVKFDRFRLSTREQFCTILDKEYTSIPYISMYDDESMTPTNVNKIAYAPYLLFEPIGDFYIKKIEFLGYSRVSNQSLPLLGFSDSSADPTGDNVTCPYNTINFDTLEDGRQGLGFPSALTAPNVCTQQGDWIGGDEDSDEYQKSIKYIRLNWSGALFAGGHTPDRGGSLELFGFQIYTNLPGLGTSIEDEVDNSFSITREGDLIKFTSFVDAKVYSLSGAIQLNASGVEEVSLESLQEGVYIVQARDIQTGKIVTEKFIK